MLEIKKTTMKDLEKIVELNLDIFDNMYDREPYDLKKYQDKLKGKEPLILVAEDKGKIVGNAIAYERDGNFYIWIMAVAKDYRGQGIAKKFLDLAEYEAKEIHLPAVTIKTHNVNKEMFALLIKRGYQVTEFIPSKTNILFNAIRLKLELD